MPDGVFWALGAGTDSYDDSLYRHDETGWRQWSLKEDRMLASWSSSPHGAAPACYERLAARDGHRP
jgi:hypothetical protein